MKLRPALIFCALVFNSTNSTADSITLYNASGVDANLLTLPGKVLSGKLKIDHSQFSGLGYQHTLSNPALLSQAFSQLGLTPPTTALELIALKHRGLQTNTELVAAYHLGFSGVGIGPLQLQPGLSWGFSWALGRPSYEDGPKDEPARRYRFQNHLGFELALSPKQAAPWSVIAKVHHRSGVYGLIAPRNVGSNFLALGLRYRFE